MSIPSAALLLMQLHNNHDDHSVTNASQMTLRVATWIGEVWASQVPREYVLSKQPAMSRQSKHCDGPRGCVCSQVQVVQCVIMLGKRVIGSK